MKKLFCALGLTLILVSIALAGIPPPFDNAKKIALTTEPVNGIYLWKAEDPDSSGLIYALAYDSNANFTALAMFDKDNLMAVQLCYVEGRYLLQEFVIVPGVGAMLVNEQELEEAAALEMAFSFFRVLVSKNLLPSLI